MRDLLWPDKVAVVGASRHKGKTGHEVFDNLKQNFEGEVVPVNPKAEEIEGLRASDETPSDTDLVVIVVPSKIVPEVMRDAAQKDVNTAIVISAGFSETGNEDLEKEVKEIAKKNGIQLLGPNILGLINTQNGLNASFAAKTPEEGAISFMSQSGAFCTAILDYAKAEHIGFRHFVSLGNKAEVNEVDLLKYWRKDKDTEVILSYTEGIQNGREFLKEAKKTSKEKPIVMVKSGRTDKGGEAASSHTGSIAGSYQAYQAAFREAGIIEAESNRELINYGRSFAYQPLPEGDNIAIITNAGGPGVITTDEISQNGLQLAEFRKTTKTKLEKEMPDESTPHNPLDVIGDAGHDRYEKALNAVTQDENVDAFIVLLTPQANTEIIKTAKAIVNSQKDIQKPIMASFIGEKDVEEGRRILEDNNIPEFEDPLDAVKSLRAMLQYKNYLERDENSQIRTESSKVSQIDEISGFTEVKELLDSYGFKQPLSKVEDAPKPAQNAASQIGYPVAMKIDSPEISHKTDIDAIATGVNKGKKVKNQFHNIIDDVYREKPETEINGVIIQEEIEGTEVALGMKRDPQFGPIIMVGLGGIYVEALQDISFGIAPVSEAEAERMINELRSSDLFQGARGKTDLMEPLKDSIAKLSKLSLEHKEIRSIDINPLIVNEQGAYAADIEINLSEN